MITYDEIIAIKKQYRIIVDQQTGEQKLVYKNTPDVEVPKGNGLKIKSAIYLYSFAEELANEYSGLYSSLAPWINDKEKLEWKKAKVAELQDFLSSIADKGEYTIKFDLGSKIADCGNTFFLDLLRDDKFSTYVSGARSLLEYTLDQKGKKLVKIDKKDMPDISTLCSWTSREKSFQERLNPNDPLYTQPEMPKPLSPDDRAKQRQFANELIKSYLMAETDSMYAKRVKYEISNMLYVANTINGSRTISEIEHDLPKLMRLLIAAQNISLDGERDYLEEIISQPAVSQALSELRKIGQLDKIRNSGNKNKQKGKVKDGRVHSETSGEINRKIANSVIKENPDAVSIAKTDLTQKNEGLVADEKTAILLCVVAIIQGKIPTYEKDRISGKYKFTAKEQVAKAP